MFFGNILIGSLNPAQQIELVQHKKLKKLQILCQKKRLYKSTVDYLFDNPDGLEAFLVEYLRSYAISSALQKKLQEKKLVQLIKVYCDSHRDFCFSDQAAYVSFLMAYGAPRFFNVTNDAEKGLFESGNEKLLLQMAAENQIFARENKIRFLRLVCRYPKEVEQYLNQYGKDIYTTDEEQLELTQENIRLFFMWKNIYLKTEGLLFEPEYKDVLLEYAHQRRFAHRENEAKFLLLRRQYPTEVWQYLYQYGKDIDLTEDNQLELTQENIRFILMWGNVYLKTEGLLFEPENKDVLLEYARQRRFAHHENEVKFLLLSKQYPKEVEQYLSQYGKDIPLTANEELKVMGSNKNALVYLNIQHPVAYREYVVSEKRKKHIPFTEEDLSMLIRLSADNPTLLNEFVEKCGKLSLAKEAELFFMADEKSREKYISLYGVDLRNLIQAAANYGATEQELDLLRQVNIEFISHIFTQLETWKRFDVETIKRNRKCAIGIYASGGVCNGHWQCEQCELLQVVLPIALLVLLNVAHRNYLLGVC